MNKYRYRISAVLIILGLTWGSISYAGENITYDKASLTVSENAGEALSVNKTAKDALSDNAISGNTVSENTVSGNTVSGNTVSENTVSENMVSENTVSENTVSENTVSENTVSENTVSDNTVSDNTVSDNTVSDNTSSENKPSEDKDNRENNCDYHYVNLECREAAYGDADIREKGVIQITARSTGCPIALLQIENAGAGIRKTLYKGDMQGRGGLQDIERSFGVTANGEYRVWAYDIKGAYDMKTVNISDMGSTEISRYKSLALKNMNEKRGRRDNKETGTEYRKNSTPERAIFGGDGKKREESEKEPEKTYTYKTGKNDGHDEDIPLSERYGNWSLMKGIVRGENEKAWLGTEAGSGREDAVPRSLQNRLDLEDYNVELFRTDIASAKAAKSEAPAGDSGVAGLKSKPQNDNIKNVDKDSRSLSLRAGLFLIPVLMILAYLILHKSIKPAGEKRRVKDDRKTHRKL